MNKLAITKKTPSKKYVKERQRQINSHLKNHYGITLDDYNITFEEQGRVCAICENKAKKGCRLHVDHNHKTGQVRGLLCPRCNVLVGTLENELLFQAVVYLGKWESKLWEEW